jgi:hypothetical protein
MPNSAYQGDSLMVTITGENTNFSQGSECTSAVTGIWFSQGSSTIQSDYYWTECSNDKVHADFRMPNNANLGYWDVHVNSPYDGGVLTLQEGFEITKLPTITSIEPDSAIAGNFLTVTITGENTDFVQGSSCSNNIQDVWLSQNSLTIYSNGYWTNCEWDGGDTEVMADFFIPMDASGEWDVNVYSPSNGGILTLHDGFYVTGGYGCTDPNAHNYDSEAILDDESCIYGPDIISIYDVPQDQGGYVFVNWLANSLDVPDPFNCQPIKHIPTLILWNIVYGNYVGSIYATFIIQNCFRIIIMCIGIRAPISSSDIKTIMQSKDSPITWTIYIHIPFSGSIHWNEKICHHLCITTIPLTICPISIRVNG